MPATQAHRELEIITPLGEDTLLLRSFNFHEQLGQAFTLEVDLLSTEEDIEFEDLLGQNSTVRMDMPNDEVRYINGYITQLSQVEHTRGFATYKAVISPWLWFLTRTSDCRIFQEMVVPDILSEVFDTLGYKDYEIRLKGNYRTWEYCVQYRETNFNFVNRLMEQEGIYYYFEHEDGKHKLILCDSPSIHSPIEGYEEVPYYPPDETVTRKEDYISNWSVNKSIQSGTYASNDYNFKKPQADLLSQFTLDEEHEAANFEIFDYPGEYAEKSEGDTYSKVRIEELHSAYEKIMGVSNARGITAGGLFNLIKFHRKDQNKEYLVTSVNHSAQQDLFTSGNDNKGNIYTNSFSIIDNTRRFRTPRVTPKPIVQGLQTAVVSGSAGEEIYTDEYARVKCQFHWDRYGEFNEKSSCWIRVAHAWAGNKWGTIYIPRIGQEVIVEFLEGDPDKPLITGQVYNEDNKPPFDLPGKKNISGTKTRSTKGGGGYNEFVMDDTAGDELIRTHAQWDMDTTVEHDDRQKIKRNRTINVDGTHTETIVGDTKITVGEGNYSHSVMTGTETRYVKGKVSEDFDDVQETVVNKEIKITSETQKVHVTAKTEIILEVGKSKLHMYENGKIELTGVNIAIKGDATITEKAVKIISDATGTNTLKGGVVTSEAQATNTVKGMIVTLNP